MSKSRVFVTLFLSLILLAAFTMLAIAKESSRDSVKIIDGFKAAKGKLAPRFEVKTLDGKTINLESLRDQKCVVITFWATWCGPCKKELPYLQKFFDNHKDECEVIGVSKDIEKAHTLLENQIKELKLTFPMVQDTGDKLRKTLFPSKGIPFLVVINKKGEVVNMSYGALNPAKLNGELEKLLADDLKAKPKEEPKVEKEATEKAKEQPKEKTNK